MHNFLFYTDQRIKFAIIKNLDYRNLLDDSDSEFLPVHRDPTAVIDYEDNKEKNKADTGKEYQDYSGREGTLDCKLHWYIVINLDR